MNEKEWLEHFRTLETDTLRFARTIVYVNIVPLIDQVLAERQVRNVFSVLRSIGY